MLGYSTDPQRGGLHNGDGIEPNYLRQWREFAGFSQTQVQQFAGWPPGRVSKLESGRAQYNAEVLQCLARLYSCRTADLLGTPPPRTPPLREEDMPTRVTADRRARDSAEFDRVEQVLMAEMVATRVKLVERVAYFFEKHFEREIRERLADLRRGLPPEI